MKKFTAKELFSKTMPFVMAKLVLRLIVAAIFLGLFGLGAFLITRGSGEAGFAGFVVIIISIASLGVSHFVFVRMMGFAVRAGHIAVLTEAIKTGKIPDNQVAYGKNKVTERIATAATFFLINKLVDRAVFQLQRRFQSATSFIGAMPGGGAFVKFANTVIKSALKYVDECCIGWIFYGPQDQSAMKGALDGVTLYAQNWKRILGTSVKSAIGVLVATYIGGFAIAVLFAVIFFSIGGIWGFFGFVFGLTAAFVVKAVFIDTMVMIRTLVVFMEDAPITELRMDMYNTLSTMSSAFADMFNRTKSEFGANSFAPAPAAARSKTIFCGECGAKNPAGTRFCGECGKNV